MSDPTTQPPAYELKPLSAVSPTFAEVLRNCSLQAFLARIPELQTFVLGSPRAWLGVAYHEVLERLWMQADPTVTDHDFIEGLWSRAIVRLQERTSAHPLNRRFSDAKRWPGYYLARSLVDIRAREALLELPKNKGASSDGAQSLLAREHEFSAMGGRLVGRPDVVLEDEIRDYKSGNIYEDTEDGKHVVKGAYIRQLQIYGYLVYECVGRCPSKGKLLPMQGAVVEVNLDSATSAKEARDAIALLDSSNERLAVALDVSALGTPTSHSCRWCQFKAICPAFWESVDSTWTPELGSGALNGKLVAAPTPIHDGRAVSISIRVSSGTTSDAEVTIAPLPIDLHSSLVRLQAGDTVRIVNLHCRQDGQFAPTARTLCFREVECPVFILPSQQNPS